MDYRKLCGILSLCLPAIAQAAPTLWDSLIWDQDYWDAIPTSACLYSLSPAIRNHTANAETGSLALTATLACDWNASSNASWVTLSSSATGTGNATVKYSVAANTSTSSRSATLTIAGQSFNITQAGLNCTYTLNPLTKIHTANAETGTISVTASPAACPWTANTNVSWASITSGKSGTGNGTIKYTLAVNSSANSRNGTLTIGGKGFAISQAGQTPAQQPDIRIEPGTLKF